MDLSSITDAATKLGGWKTAAAAIAFWALAFAAPRGLLPVDFPSPWPQGLVIAAAIFTMLTIMAIIEPLSKVALSEFKTRGERRRQEEAREAGRQRLRDYIPHLTPQERAIIINQLDKNERTLMLPMEGGRAASLISHGIIVRHLRPGQAFEPDSVPFLIPESVWAILKEEEAQIRNPPARGSVASS